MPIDQNELYAGFTEEQLRKLLPADSVEEYIRQGKPAGPDDDEWHVIGFDEEGNQVGPEKMDKAVKKVYQRRLRDYAVEFSELNRRRVLLLANIAAVTQDNLRLKEALTSAKGLEEFRTEEIRKLSIDLAGVKKEREIIDTHLATIQQQLANAQQLLKEAIAENRRLSEELAQRDARYRERGGSLPNEGPLALSP
jgi:chromosome segregation ATPase